MSKSSKHDKHDAIWTFMILMVAFEMTLLMGLFLDAFALLLIPLNRISIFLGFVLPYFACMTARQLGNVALARTTGRDFVSFQIGSWVLVRRRGQLALKRAQWASWPSALVLPDGRASLAQTRLHYLSGALANLCLGALSYALFLRFPTSRGWSLYLLIQFPMALFFALWEGIPHRIGGNPNAALMAIRFREGQGGMGSPDQALCAQAMCHLARGESLGQIPEEWFEPTEGGEPSRSDWIAYYKLIRLMDVGQEQRAHDWAVDLLSSERRFPYAVRMQICGLLLVDRMLGMDIPESVEMPEAGEIEDYFEYDAKGASASTLRYAQALLERRDEEDAARIRAKLERTLKIAHNVGDPARYIRRLDRILDRYRESNQHEFSSSACAAE